MVLLGRADNGAYHRIDWDDINGMLDWYSRHIQRFYIQPDSQFLLKAKEMDVLCGPCGDKIFNVTKTLRWDNDISIEYAQQCIDESDWKVMMRWRPVQGKMANFHWPEREAA
ncbi:MAG: hypothetical protein ACP5XB_03055 [Isosphaeraceae bacterium]